MQTLPCGHVAHRGTSRLCLHLLAALNADDDLDYLRLLTGIGLEHDLCVLRRMLPGGLGGVIDFTPLTDGSLSVWLLLNYYRD